MDWLGVHSENTFVVCMYQPAPNFEWLGGFFQELGRLSRSLDIQRPGPPWYQQQACPAAATERGAIRPQTRPLQLAMCSPRGAPPRVPHKHGIVSGDLTTCCPRLEFFYYSKSYPHHPLCSQGQEALPKVRMLPEPRESGEARHYSLLSDELLASFPVTGGSQGSVWTSRGQPGSLIRDATGRRKLHTADPWPPRGDALAWKWGRREDELRV